MPSNAPILLPTPAQNMPVPSYVPVTPALAQRWLKGNAVNRKVREAKVQQYARSMQSGGWTFGESAICFSPEGRLLNGQHRLNAIIRSGCTVTMLVLENVPEESMTNMDTGSIRSASDALSFSGEKNTALLAATLKQCLLYSDGRVYKDNKVQACSHGELAVFLDEHPEIRYSVERATRVRSHIDGPPSTLATTHWIIGSKAALPLADYYLDQIATRANEPSGSAVLAVDARLREVRRSKRSYPWRNYVYMLINGWNYYARNRPVRVLYMAPSNGEFRIPTPVRWSR